MTMTTRQLAEKLCTEVSRRRAQRIGETPSELPAFVGLPASEQQPWLDVAEAILTMQGAEGDAADKLRELVLDWDRYTLMIQSPPWRDEMRRAVVIEMRLCVERLWAECGGE